MVVVADPAFVESGGSGRLDAAEEAGLGQVGEHVVHGLHRDAGQGSPQHPVQGLGAGMRMRRERLERGDATRRDPQARGAQLGVRLDIHEPSLSLIMNHSKLRRTGPPHCLPGDDSTGPGLELRQVAGLQDSGNGVIICASSGPGFDLVAQGEVGAGVSGLGGGEVFTQLCD